MFKMYTNHYNKSDSQIDPYKNPYDSDDESYELLFINRKKELEEQIELLNNKYETDSEDLECVYFGYHYHYHKFITELSSNLNTPNYKFNPGEKAHIESQILTHKKNLNDQLIISKQKKIELEKAYEEQIYCLRSEILHIQIIYEQSLHYHIKKKDELAKAMENMSI